ncbi:hypothetical protein GW17_00024853 [Ensete ventricosum]|nr:hypothetical protein GW17_00024853 [Ensete ventricosum]
MEGGGGGDAFGSSTAPLTWHDFLERMRHPSAADFVKSIKRSVSIASVGGDAPYGLLGASCDIASLGTLLPKRFLSLPFTSKLKPLVSHPCITSGKILETSSMQ